MWQHMVSAKGVCACYRHNVQQYYLLILICTYGTRFIKWRKNEWGSSILNLGRGTLRFRVLLCCVNELEHFWTFNNIFITQGLGDLTAYICTDRAIDFFHSIGGRKAIYGYIKSLLDWAEQMLTDYFRVKPLEIPESMRAPYMRVIGKSKINLYWVYSPNVSWKKSYSLTIFMVPLLQFSNH